MMATWQIVAVVLLAVLVGAVVPVLLQMRRTLQSAENVLKSTGPKLDRTKDAEGLGVFTDAAAGLGRSLKQAQESLRVMTAVGAAVGPAIAAGLRALFAPDRGDDARSPRAEEAGVVTDAPGDGRSADGSAGTQPRGESIRHE